MAKHENLYKLIDKQCNAEQIRDLLRKYKDVNKESKKEVHITGTKEDVIKNLSRVVSKGIVPQSEVKNLLRECEENGQQHIFFFRAKSSSQSACRDFATIARALGGANWHKKMPLYDFIPDTFHWVDLRQNIDGKPKDWIAKIYGQEQVFRQTRVENPSPTRRIEYYSAETIRVVCLVRWNNPDLLEIRVDSQRLESVKTKKQRLALIWKMLAGALSPSQFVEWDLESARSFMMSNRQKAKDFTLGDLRLTDTEGGSATFKTNTDEESVDDLAERSEAINTLSKAGSSCDVLRVHWVVPPEKKKENKVELTTICGGQYTNEMAVRARTSSFAIGYVTDRLRQLNSRTT